MVMKGVFIDQLYPLIIKTRNQRRRSRRGGQSDTVEQYSQGMEESGRLGNSGRRLRPVVDHLFKPRRKEQEVSIVVKGLNIISIAHPHMALFPDLGVELLISPSVNNDRENSD